MGKLDGKVAIVTGSGRGIGAEIAVKLAADGAAVVVNDLDEQPAKETVAAIESAGGKAVACPGSVTAPGFAERFTQAAVDSFGGLDIIINNAGYTWDSVIQKMTDDQWDAILDVHLKAPFRILRAAQPVISGLVKRAAASGEKARQGAYSVEKVTPRKAGLNGSPEPHRVPLPLIFARSLPNARRFARSK